MSEADTAETPMPTSSIPGSHPNWKTRLKQEFDQIGERVHQLEAFIGTEEHAALAEIEKVDLAAELAHMRGYLHTLGRRVLRHL